MTTLIQEGLEAAIVARRKASFECAGHNVAVENAIRAYLEYTEAWQDIVDAPRNQRVIIKSPSGEQYIGHWVQSPDTMDEAFLVSESPDGTQHLIHPTHFRWLSNPKEVTK